VIGKTARGQHKYVNTPVMKAIEMKMKTMFRNIVGAIVLPLIVIGCSTTPKQSGVDPAVKAKEMIVLGETDQALKFLESAMIADPERLELSNMYRAESVKLKRHEASINFFKSRTELKGASNQMYYNLAFAYIDKIPTVGPMGSGFLSKRAIAQFQAVLDKEPEDWIATYGIGMNYLHWPDYFKKNDSASKYLEDSLGLQRKGDFRPYYILTYIRLGDAYAKTGEIDKAYEIWKEGLEYFPTHKDLKDRIATPKSRIAKAMVELYNPNNSIGEINTDISVLWMANVPQELVPLKKNSLKQAGIGGLIKGSKAKLGDGEIGLFAWFMRNLPFLSDKNNSANVDMSLLGIGDDAANRDLASVVANGMIMGFLSQFEDETPSQARTKADGLTAFNRPFFHEGLGMGYAATASLDNIEELKNLITVLRETDPSYSRLHLAGAGMWYGLESSTDLDQVKRAFSHLGPFGEAYAYEGYGFAQTLFYYKRNPELLEVGLKLPEESAKNFYHGAGRALWILTGNDLDKFTKRLAALPSKYREDAYSGYGMGVAFTKTGTPDYIFSFLGRNELKEENLTQHFMTGVSMGLVIRNQGSPSYISTVKASASKLDQCRISSAIKTGEDALSDVSSGGADLHSDWRKEVYRRLTSVTRDAKECA